jgi:carbon monoxide dehydrogenase subunit G
MTRIESKVVDLDNSAKNIFNFLSDFNNYEKLMPSQVTNWSATKDECNFTISGMATIGMKIVEKVPHSLVRMESHGKVPFNFTLTANVNETGAKSCKAQLVMDADLNMMLKMMAEKPLRNFLDMLAEKLKEVK